MPTITCTPDPRTTPAIEAAREAVAAANAALTQARKAAGCEPEYVAMPRALLAEVRESAYFINALTAAALLSSARYTGKAVVYGDVGEVECRNAGIMGAIGNGSDISCFIVALPQWHTPNGTAF
jgi:hypothetical protein